MNVATMDEKATSHSTGPCRERSSMAASPARLGATTDRRSAWRMRTTSASRMTPRTKKLICLGCASFEGSRRSLASSAASWSRLEMVTSPRLPSPRLIDPGGTTPRLPVNDTSDAVCDSHPPRSRPMEPVPPTTLHATATKPGGAVASPVSSAPATTFTRRSSISWVDSE